MRPLNVIIGIAITLGLVILLGWTHDKRRATKICAWGGAVLTLLVVRWFAPFDIGPASWADVSDWIMPDGYAEHTVETSISAQPNWLVGETKECYSAILDPSTAYHLGRESGYVASSIECDDGPHHDMQVKIYGRLEQPENKPFAIWNCTHNADGFTCRQTGAGDKPVKPPDGYILETH